MSINQGLSRAIARVGDAAETLRFISEATSETTEISRIIGLLNILSDSLYDVFYELINIENGGK